MPVLPKVIFVNILKIGTLDYDSISHSVRYILSYLLTEYFLSFNFMVMGSVDINDLDNKVNNKKLSSNVLMMENNPSDGNDTDSGAIPHGTETGNSDTGGESSSGPSSSRYTGQYPDYYPVDDPKNDGKYLDPNVFYKYDGHSSTSPTYDGHYSPAAAAAPKYPILLTRSERREIGIKLNVTADLYSDESLKSMLKELENPTIVNPYIRPSQYSISPDGTTH